ncbi:hypothetical protein V1520DRAFT_348664 [Lipomyces starkeyi]|uniref:Uncharacterized protein n=1 Tax=Lipomyces starkeyi NRRL Y-11557 TaxID=675824 RepID=A0A1E3QEJ0_LIPST|nr:hypothetical protein LIPSTDRAFT_68698 [Lipomyces starkeyi NRRL Y-11557]
MIDSTRFLQLFLPFVGLGPFVFFEYFHPRPSFRHLKSSEAFVKRPYNTESLLADAASAKYKVHIEHDAPLSSCSYTPSPYFPSVLIPIRTSSQKRTVLYGSAFMVVVFGLLAIVLLVWSAVGSYVDVDNSFLAYDVWSADGAFALVCLLLGVATLKSSFKEDDAVCATVYLNTSEEDWVESSEGALFNSSEKIEISITWAQELLVYVSSGLCYCSPLLYREREPDRETAMSVVRQNCVTAIICLYLVCSCLYVVGGVMSIRAARQLISTVEVQLAQPVSLECTGKADALTFDVKKIVRKYAHDLVKNLGKKWKASNGAYYYFIISGEEGGLVYGRMSAKEDLADP